MSKKIPDLYIRGGRDIPLEEYTVIESNRQFVIKSLYGGDPGGEALNRSEVTCDVMEDCALCIFYNDDGLSGPCKLNTEEGLDIATKYGTVEGKLKLLGL